MNEYSIIGIILAVIGIFKGKDIWEFLKHLTDSRAKKNDALIAMFEQRLKEKDEMIQERDKRIRDLEKKKAKLEKLISK